MSEASRLTVGEQQAWRAYVEMQHRLERYLGRALQRDFGLSEADFEVLVNLSESPGSCMRAVDLGRATQWEKSRLSHHLRRMEDRGLVRRQAGSGRYPEIVLTGAGRAAIEAAAPANAARVRQLFVEVLGPDRLDTMRAIAEDVMAAITAHQEADCTGDN
jgi:DNA-binding MarR family transcriptional regulator